MNKKIINDGFFGKSTQTRKTYRDLSEFLDGIEDFHFIFKTNTTCRLKNIIKLKNDLKKAIKTVDQDPIATQILFNLLVMGHTNVQPPLNAISQNYNPKNFKEEEKYDGEIITGYNKIEIFNNKDICNAVQQLKTMICAFLLSIFVEDRITGNKQTHSQNFRHLLSALTENKPEFLMVYPSTMLMIINSNNFAIEERGRASRMLINSFRIEDLYIHISTDPNMPDSDKNLIFKWLTAYQKVYRKIISIMIDQKSIKEKIFNKWFFTKGLTEKAVIARKWDKPMLQAQCYLLIENLTKGKEYHFLEILRILMATMEIDELIRHIHFAVTKSDIQDNVLRNKIYNNLYRIINEYRQIVNTEMEASLELKQKMIIISRNRRLHDQIMLQNKENSIQTPLLGKWRQHKLHKETRKNLEESGLLHLFDMWPIPKNSQEIFNFACTLKKLMTDKHYLISHHLYREKVLEFLMRLDRIGIKVIKNSNAPIMTNAVQLNELSLIKAGMYMASTGHWRNPEKRPPAVIHFTKPQALGNCMGHMLRHIVNRVFLGTGEHYMSPFVIDSTQRYGELDEKGENSLFIRPGLFFIDIPQPIINHWDNVQKRQSIQLRGAINKKILQENGF